VDALIVVRSKLAIPALRGIVPYLLLVPALFLVALLLVGLLELAWKSFHTYDAFRAIQGPLSLEQYRRLFTGVSSTHIITTIVTTIFMAIVVTITNLTLGLPLAYFILRLRSNGWRFVAMILLLVPFLMGEIVRAFGWYILLGRRGVLTWVLSSLGIHDVTLLGSLWGVWLGMIQVGLPIAVLVMLPALKRINPDLERAANTLGASPARTWRHVIVPLSRQGLVSAGIVVFSLSMTEFAMPAVLGLGRRPFVANEIETMFFFQSNQYLGSALSVTLMVIVIACVAVISKLGFRRRGAA
jgi:putative spermidine/putrescine transport system permease protein